MADLLHDVEAFLKAHPDIKPTRFGAEALGDRHFVRTLRAGRRLWPETEAKVRSFMEEHGSNECKADCLGGGAERVAVHAHRMTENGAQHHVG